MSWKAPLGHVAAAVVQAIARAGSTPERPLDDFERSLLEPVFAASVDYARVRLREGVRGLLNLSARAS